MSRELISKSFNHLDFLFLFIFLCQSSWWNMFKILEPFKVRNSDSTDIDKHIRYDYNSSFLEHFFSHKSSWTISSFNNNFTLKFICIFIVNWSFNCSRNQNITRKFHEWRWVNVSFLMRFRITINRTIFIVEIFNIIDIKPILVIDCRIMLYNSHNLSTIFSKEFSCPKTYITKSLYNNFFVSYSIR